LLTCLNTVQDNEFLPGVRTKLDLNRLQITIAAINEDDVVSTCAEHS
jgi:hypothetical protein